MSVEAWAIKDIDGDIMLSTIRYFKDQVIEKWDRTTGAFGTGRKVGGDKGYSCIRVRISEVKEGE